MKKTYIAPQMMELNFRDTESTCGIKQRRVVSTSGNMSFTDPKCFSLNNWLTGMGSFGDEDPEDIEEVD